MRRLVLRVELDEAVLDIADADAGCALSVADGVHRGELVDLDDFIAVLSFLLHFVGLQAGPVVRDCPRSAILAVNGSAVYNVALDPLLLLLVPLVLDLVHEAFPARCHVFLRKISR